jgi:heme a synthase
MASIGTAPARISTPSLALRRFAWLVLAYNVLVILWGAAVRATGSGGGCGEHWPLCNGNILLHHPKLATVIEFAHRMSSGVALLAVVALVVWVFRTVPKYHLARFCALAALVLTLNEALLGALLVLLGLVADNHSPARTVYFALHFTNTLLMLASFTGAAHFLSRSGGYLRGSVRLHSKRFALPGLAALLIVGVSGSLAALGDTLFPSTNLRGALLQDFSGHGSWLIRLRWLHPAFALLSGAFVLWLVLCALQKPAQRALALGVVGLLCLQYCLGLADVVLLAPTWLQLVHLLGADLVWISVVILSLRICVTE